MNIILVMQQTNTQFIKNLNKFHTCTQTLEDIQSINSNFCQQIPNILITLQLFYTNTLVQKIIHLCLTKHMAQHLILRL
jgi:hypothetical protein